MPATIVNSQAIVTVFDSLVKGIKTTIQERNHNNAVDVRLDFKSINITKNNIIVWSKVKDRTMEISLATQITPDE